MQGIACIHIFSNIAKFVPESVEAHPDFTSALFTMNQIPTSVNLISTSTNTPPFPLSNPSFTSELLIYNAIPNLNSDVYFQTGDQSFNITEGFKTILVPDLSCSSTGATSIEYSGAGYNGGSLPSFISVDKISGNLNVSAPYVNSDTIYSFYLNSKLGTSNPVQKKINLLVINCVVQNCQKCLNPTGSVCEICDTGYSYISNVCVQDSQSISEISKIIRFTMQLIFAAILCIVTVSNVSLLSTLSSLWLLVHQTQVFFFILISNAFIPEDVINVITGVKIALFPFIYLPLDKIEYNNQGVQIFEFGLKNIHLKSLNISSDSTIYNSFNMIVTIIALLIIHPPVLLANRWISNINNGRCSCLVKIAGILVNKVFVILTFGIYIRIILESNQYLLISAVNEVYEFNTSTSLKIVSLTFAIFVLIFCVAMIVIVGCLAASSYEVTEGNHNRFGEIFSGLKIGKSKFYSLLLLLRRAIFIAALVVLAEKSFIAVIGSLCFVQLLYICLLILMRPFKEIKCNLIEIINEIYFSLFFGWLLVFNTKYKWTETLTTTYMSILLSNYITCLLIVLADALKNFIVKLKSNCAKSQTSARVVPNNVPQLSQIETQLRDFTQRSSKLDTEISNSGLPNSRIIKEENKYAVDESLPSFRFNRDHYK